MHYKLYDNKTYNSTIETIFGHRGISDINTWLSASVNNICNYNDLEKQPSDISTAILWLEHTIKNNQNILVVVDSDADGYTSAAIIINYIYMKYPDYATNHIKYFLHTGKQHGLSDVTIDDDIHFVICPDSASNDYEMHEELNQRNIKLLILDHHEAPHISTSSNTITLNNQLTDYSNKELSGAGVTWQFCRAWDDFNKDYKPMANDFLDLCALGLLSDMMDHRSLETRTLIHLGLQNIKNPFFFYMCEKNEYSINKKGGINYMSIAFYVTPFINAIVRSGTMEEKDLIFKSMLLQFAFSKVESGKRGDNNKLVPLVNEAIRVATNVKNRQNKLQDTTMVLLEQKIIDEKLNDSSILLLLCEPGDVEPNIAGLCANKIQAKYQKPTAILTRTKDKDNKEYSFRGSARNYSMCEIQNFREICEDTQCVEFAQGHEGAFGLSIADSQLNNFIQKIEEKYVNVSQEPTYYVDYVWKLNQMDSSTILEIADMTEYWGTGMPESKIALVDVILSQCDIKLVGVEKGHPTLQIKTPQNITLIKFNSSQAEYDSLCEDNTILTAICLPNKNVWNGNTFAQLMIDDYTIEKRWVF